jgi:hypothetical protein
VEQAVRVQAVLVQAQGRQMLVQVRLQMVRMVQSEAAAVAQVALVLLRPASAVMAGAIPHLMAHMAAVAVAVAQVVRVTIPAQAARAAMAVDMAVAVVVVVTKAALRPVYLVPAQMALSSLPTHLLLVASNQLGRVVQIHFYT